MPELKPFELLGLSLQELTSLAEACGEKPYRARQLFEGLYRQRVGTLDQISTLPQTFLMELAERGWSIGLPGIEKRFASKDGTVRYLMTLADGQSVETVWMPDGDESEIDDAGGRGGRRATICVSSQVGCAVDCQFCLTALLG